MKILLDTQGGDNPIEEFVFGGIEALKANDELELAFVGKKDDIQNAIYKAMANLGKKEKPIDASRMEIIDAPDVITNEDVPTEAIRYKKESSMVKGFYQTKDRDDIAGMVTAGSTGAALTGATLIIGRLKGVRRAALCPVLPLFDGGRVCICDAGANVDSAPEFLEQFALMGNVYMKEMCAIEVPRVALVSNGTEDKKGNALVQAALPLLRELPINFVGNMEARDALSGNYDVLVADGFVGNVMLKSYEGCFGGMLKQIKTVLTSSGKAKFGALFVKSSLKAWVKKIGLDELAAAAFLGCNKLIAKAHGNAKAAEVKAALNQVYKMAKADIVSKLATAIG